MPLSYARRTHCPKCGVPNTRKPNRICRYCYTKACGDCIKKCCAKAIQKKNEADERSFNRFSAYFMRWLGDHHVKLSPVIESDGKGGQRLVRWMAGYVVLAGDGFQNIVKDQAEGKTPLEALSNLGNGKYYKGGA